ncbi:MAG TPA: UxaA family hydrolase [Duganella sp.]|uniref:UxaA family hydrolase n=1 Tax=Duganella sp. TaxID=1904440 RepID=UPI002ECFD02F
MPNTQAPRLLLMSPDDNCLIARVPLAAGESLEIDGAPVVLPEAVPLGYKVARGALRRGDKVLRYGAIIGTVTADVAPGAMLHTHNLVSDYIPTYTLASDTHSFIGSTH